MWGNDLYLDFVGRLYLRVIASVAIPDFAGQFCMVRLAKSGIATSYLLAMTCFINCIAREELHQPSDLRIRCQLQIFNIGYQVQAGGFTGFKGPEFVIDT